MSSGQENDAMSGRAGGVESVSIGRRLAHAREARKLTIQKVADSLHLDVRMVEALERDDRAALPSPIFVKGYLRGYAGLVGLPAEELVSEYTALAGEPPPLTVVSIKQKVPFFQLPSARLLRKIILLLLAAILVWLAYPFVEQLIVSRGLPEGEPLPGRLELPPVNNDTGSAASLETE
jgi:cytoskeleton protein RodZ